MLIHKKSLLSTTYLVALLLSICITCCCPIPGITSSIMSHNIWHSLFCFEAYTNFRNIVSFGQDTRKLIKALFLVFVHPLVMVQFVSTLDELYSASIRLRSSSFSQQNSLKAPTCRDFEPWICNSDSIDYRLPVRPSGIVEKNFGILKKIINGLACLHMEIHFPTHAFQVWLGFGN